MKAVNNYIEVRKLETHSEGVLRAVEKIAAYTVVDRGIVDDVLNDSVIHCSPMATINYKGRLFLHRDSILY